MENGFFIEKLATLFGGNASVKNVYGEPIKSGDKTIIPVAQIAYGLGGGYGHGRKKNKPVQSNESSGDENKPTGEGAGGGGGMYAKPSGVYEVTATGTRFIPANNNRKMLTALVIGFLIRQWLYSKQKKKLAGK